MPERNPIIMRTHSSLPRGKGVRFAGAAAPFVIAGALALPGCMTRSDTPVWGPDSTQVYPSRLANDVGASITFQLKDSALRDTQKRRDRERGREISRLRRQRGELQALEEMRSRERQAQAEAKRKAQLKKAGLKKGKRGKKNPLPGEASGADPLASSVAEKEDARLLPDTGVRDSLAAIDARLAALAAEDSAAASAPWKIKRADGKPAEERAFDIEEGARVQAALRLENVYARGKRPLMFHFVWLNPERKRVFKRMVEYVPNDSTQVLTSSLSITPAKRSPGRYTLQLFLFREQIAEKSFVLKGKGTEEQEKSGGESM
jgi:hypothetical protein